MGVIDRAHTWSDIMQKML